MRARGDLCEQVVSFSYTKNPDSVNVFRWPTKSLDRVTWLTEFRVRLKGECWKCHFWRPKLSVLHTKHRNAVAPTILPWPDFGQMFSGKSSLYVLGGSTACKRTRSENRQGRKKFVLTARACWKSEVGPYNALTQCARHFHTVTRPMHKQVFSERCKSYDRN